MRSRQEGGLSLVIVSVSMHSYTGLVKHAASRLIDERRKNDGDGKAAEDEES